MKIRQINCNKCRQSNYDLCHLISKDFSTIYLVQEPYLYKGRIPGLPKGFESFGVKNSRAQIVAHSSMPVMYCHELSSSDYTVVIYENEGVKILLASIYLDITYRTVNSPSFTKICDFLTDVKMQGILGLDSNAHSVLWGSNKSNDRGEQMEEIISQYSLRVLNVGSKPTWKRGNSNSIIDITLGTENVQNIVTNWKVRNENYSSDHFMIEFLVKCRVQTPPTIKKTDWNSFSRHLVIDDLSYPSWSWSTIEKEAAALVTAITKAKRSATYETPLKPKSAKWWNSQLHGLKQKCNKLWSISTRHPTAANKALFVEAKKSLAKAIKRSKRQAWQNHVESINDPKSMSQLNKAVKNCHKEQIGLLKKSTGEYTRSIQSSITYLMNTHFPNSVPISGPTNRILRDDTEASSALCFDEDLNRSFITEHKVTLAINSFGSDKTGGPDNLKPIALQQFIKNPVALKRLTQLYRAMIELSYTPKIWCDSKVIFLPKPGKDNYEEAKSFRPISLLSFFLKAAERLVLWEMEQNSLKRNPIHRLQYAFKKGFSCETALSELVDEIECNITREKYALAVFLDIAGAFDSLQYNDIISALRSRNASEKLIKWYENFLLRRTAFTEIKGHNKSFSLVQGTAQGAILSPKVWNIVFDSFIKHMNEASFEEGGIICRCFADDGCLMITGPDPSTLAYLMQKAINKAVNWGNQKGLKFVPHKTVAMFFHRKKVPYPKTLNMNGHELKYSKLTKYLGVHIDEKLSFDKHIELKLASTKKHFMLIKNAIGSLWGPTPAALHWAIQGILIPSLAYGALIWSKVCKKVHVQKKLNKLNRLMALCLAPVRKSTPTAGLEIIYGLKPLDLRIEELALNALARVIPLNPKKWDRERNKTFGHIQVGKENLESIGLETIMFDTSNEMNLDKEYFVDLDSFKSGKVEANYNNALICYTDGSKIENKTGFGFGITELDSVIVSDTGQLGPKNSVFQAEITAIKHCADAAIELHSANIIIYSDSQAALSALENHKIKHKTVEDCVVSLNNLAKSKTVVLKWVKAHNDITGNELADQLAKDGTTNTVNKVEIPPPPSWAKHKIAQFIGEKWSERWNSKDEYRQTKMWFDIYDKGVTSFLLKLNRIDLGLAIQLLTGHNRLNRHESLVTPGTNPKCRKCDEGEETSFHILGFCKDLSYERYQTFGEWYVNDPLFLTVYQALKFMYKINFKKMNERRVVLNPS